MIMLIENTPGPTGMLTHIFYKGTVWINRIELYEKKIKFYEERLEKLNHRIKVKKLLELRRKYYTLMLKHFKKLLNIAKTASSICKGKVKVYGEMVHKIRRLEKEYDKTKDPKVKKQIDKLENIMKQLFVKDSDNLQKFDDLLEKEIKQFNTVIKPLKAQLRKFHAAVGTSIGLSVLAGYYGYKKYKSHKERQD